MRKPIGAEAMSEQQQQPYQYQEGVAPVPAPPMPGAAPTPARNPKRRQIIVLVVFLVLVAGGFATVYAVTRHSPAAAKVGDCVHQTGTDEVEVIGCDDPAATYKVVGRVEDQTQIQAGISSCDPFPGADQVFWSGAEGKTGYVLCLAPNH